MVRSPQSGLGLQFAADLKRSTRLRCVRIMLQGYNRSILISEKTFRLFRWKRLGYDTGRRWRNISPRDGSTKTCNTPSLQDDRRLVCSRATSGFTPPPVTVIFGLFSFFVFLDYENQKTIFISDFIIIDTVSRSFVTNEKLCQVWIFNKLESME